jgi:hypothetical protein
LEKTKHKYLILAYDHQFGDLFSIRIEPLCDEASEAFYMRPCLPVREDPAVALVRKSLDGKLVGILCSSSSLSAINSQSSRGLHPVTTIRFPLRHKSKHCHPMQQTYYQAEQPTAFDPAIDDKKALMQRSALFDIEPETAHLERAELLGWHPLVSRLHDRHRI